METSLEMVNGRHQTVIRYCRHFGLSSRPEVLPKSCEALGALATVRPQLSTAQACVTVVLRSEMGTRGGGEAVRSATGAIPEDRSTSGRRQAQCLQPRLSRLTSGAYQAPAFVMKKLEIWHDFMDSF